MTDDTAKGTLSVSYIKATTFKNVHVDGCFGGPSPRGYVHMGVYSERVALPRGSTIEVVNDHPGLETIVDTRGGVIREFEADLIMDVQTALSISVWLRTKADETRVALGMPDEVWNQILQAVGAQ